jgi:hypothetical protein
MKAIIASACVLAAACADVDLDPAARRPREPGTDDPAVTAPPSTCPSEAGRTYTGFGKTNLTRTREQMPAVNDRARLKPYDALAGELARVLGSTPASLAAAASALDVPQPRWYSEPTANAGSVYTAYSVAFDGCLTKTATDGAYAAAPTPESAATECAAMARKFWSRAPTADELKACVELATVGTASEGLPRRRWAYTCAALITSAGFLTY